MNYIQKLNFDFIEFLGFLERPFRAKFIPSKVWDDLDQYKNDATGLRNYFKKWRFRIQFHKEKKPCKRISIGGGYYTEMEYCELDIWTSPDTTYDKFKFTETTWKRFKFRVIQVMMHEFVHFRQYYGKPDTYCATSAYYKRSGKKKLDENRRYHAGKDEIEAHAHCTYLDFKMRRPTIPVATLIRYAKTYRVSGTLSGIQRTFKTDKHNEVVPLLLRKILVWERKYNKLNIE